MDTAFRKRECFGWDQGETPNRVIRREGWMVIVNGEWCIHGDCESASLVSSFVVARGLIDPLLISEPIQFEW